MEVLVLALDFGSNSNKYLLSVYRNKTLKVLKKSSFVHKIAQNLNIENYQKNLLNFVENIKQDLENYNSGIFKTKKTKKIIKVAIGTEFYRSSFPEKQKIIEINKNLLEKLEIPFKIISQEEESKLSTKPIEYFFNNYISIDLGGASTEITIKTPEFLKKFFYKFGCLTENYNFQFLDNFINFYLREKLFNSELILIGGSFIATLKSIKLNIKDQKFFYTLTLNQIKRFLEKINPLNESEIFQKYPALKDRENSVKIALNFITYFLEKIKKEKVKISLLTLLEGLTLELLELNKLELNKIIKKQ